MVEDQKSESFQSRFVRLKDERGLSFEALSEDIYNATGVRISHASLHKYTKGGDIEEPTLAALASYFGKTPAWFRYGIESPADAADAKLGEAIKNLPDKPRQLVLDLLQYEYSSDATRVLVSEKLANDYTRMVQSIIRDMDQKRKDASQ